MISRRSVFDGARRSTWVGSVLSVLAALLILSWFVFGITNLQTRAYLFVGVVAIYAVSGFFVYLWGLAIGTELWGSPG
jgi:hypothetical protein